MVHHFLEGSHTGAKPQVESSGSHWALRDMHESQRTIHQQSTQVVFQNDSWHQEEAATYTRAIQGIRQSGKAHPSLFVCTLQLLRKELSEFW